MRPVSNTMRRQLGALANSPAIACAVDSALLSRTTMPSRSRTQTCVSSIEISRHQNSPLNALLFHILANRIGLRRTAAHYPMLKNSNFSVDLVSAAAGSVDGKFLRGSSSRQAIQVRRLIGLPVPTTDAENIFHAAVGFSPHSISGFFNIG